MDEPRPGAKLDKRFVVQDQSHDLEQGCRTRPFPRPNESSLLKGVGTFRRVDVPLLSLQANSIPPCAGPRGLYQGVPDRPAEASDESTRLTRLELDTDKTYI